jgi:phage baseplate assembly protein W
MTDIPHFAFPFQRRVTYRDGGLDPNLLGGDQLPPIPVYGQVAVVEQDDTAHIDACCQVITRCPVGFRIERPEFGWRFPEFRTAPLDTDALVSAIQRFEPRVSEVRAREYADVASDVVRHISIDVGVIQGA